MTPSGQATQIAMEFGLASSPAQLRRIARASAMLEQPGAVQQVEDGIYAVTSQADPELVHVVKVFPIAGQTYAQCSCPDHTKHPSTTCKHILATLLWQSLESAQYDAERGIY